jgi:hypothetical protein
MQISEMRVGAGLQKTSKGQKNEKKLQFLTF